MEYLFLFRKKDDDDRDCCAYIEDEPAKFEHSYFAKLHLDGACYRNSNFPNYEDIETVLTKEEYERLLQFSKDIKDLGFSITIGDARYEKGLQLRKGILDVYDRLKSYEAQDFFEQIQKGEFEYLKNEYGLSSGDIEAIFDEYTLDYRDRAVVQHVFNNAYDLGYKEAFMLDYVTNDDNDPRNRFFDFKKFGEALVEECEQYVQLANDRIVSLSY